MDCIYMVTVEHLYQFYPQEVKKYGIETLYDLANGHALYHTPIQEVSLQDLQRHISFQLDFEVIDQLRCAYETSSSPNSVFYRIVSQLQECSCNKGISKEDIEEMAIRAKKSIIPMKNRETLYQEISKYIKEICTCAEKSRYSNDAVERSR